MEANVGAEVTPSKQEVKKLISEKFSVPLEAIRLKGIHGKFGSKVFRIEANVYSSAEDKEKTEPKTKKEIEEEKKAAEQKVEEKKTEEQTQEAPKKEPQPEHPQEKEVEENSTASPATTPKDNDKPQKDDE